MIKIKVKKLESLKEKSIGLLNSQKPVSVFFKTRFGIHTFFMKYPIDVLILDKKNRVVSLKSLKPNRIFLWFPIYNSVLELPQGFIHKNIIKKGDEIKLDFL